MGGAIDAKAVEKVARFVRMADAFNTPIVNLTDTPAFMVSTESDREGIIRRGAKMIYAYAEATVPIIMVMLRKGYAGAFVAQGSKHIGEDLVYA